MPNRRTVTHPACVVVWLLTAAGVPADEVSSSTGLPAEPGRQLAAVAPEAVIGDRLFFETRFSQHFFAHSRGDVNVAEHAPDPLVEKVPRAGRASLPGPFRGRSVSCRHCHLGDDFIRHEPQAQRTYSDFSARTQVPDRNDGHVTTVRNTSQMVGLGLAREVPALFHYDGEFATAEALIVATLLGRNMGWKIGEEGEAVAHIARVIRLDRGLHPRHARDRNGGGLPYRVLMSGADEALPEDLVVPEEYRIDVLRAADEEIVRAVARFIHAYMDSIRFGADNTHRTARAPYDLFLSLNDLPALPRAEESHQSYARRLSIAIDRRPALRYVTDGIDGRFELHAQAYRFGPEELEGLKIFLRKSSDGAGNAGNCAACHVPPDFTDHRLHNTGVSQAEYDAIFGAGAFDALDIPTLAERSLRPNQYLPATKQHPGATGRFRSVPSKDRPGYADLGVWNIFANEDYPAPQRAVTSILCAATKRSDCIPATVLPRTIALFKTPALRDLGHSDPYLHSGAAASLEDVLTHYVTSADLARRGRLRNGSPQLLEIRLDADGRRKLAQFLRSLNEDYH